MEIACSLRISVTDEVVSRLKSDFSEKGFAVEEKSRTDDRVIFSSSNIEYMKIIKLCREWIEERKLRNWRIFIIASGTNIGMTNGEDGDEGLFSRFEYPNTCSSFR